MNVRSVLLLTVGTTGDLRHFDTVVVQWTLPYLMDTDPNTDRQSLVGDQLTETTNVHPVVTNGF